DADVVFDDELIETIEAIGIGVGREEADAEPARELEFPAVGRMVPAKALDAERDRRDLVFFEQRPCGLYLRFRRGERDVLAVQLGIADAELLHLFERAFEGEFAEAVALNAD